MHLRRSILSQCSASAFIRQHSSKLMICTPWYPRKIKVYIIKAHHLYTPVSSENLIIKAHHLYIPVQNIKAHPLSVNRDILRNRNIETRHLYILVSSEHVNIKAHHWHIRAIFGKSKYQGSIILSAED